MFQLGQQVFIPKLETSGKIISVDVLWGEHIYDVWVPSRERVDRFSEKELQAEEKIQGELGDLHTLASLITFLASGAKIENALSTQNVLLAPLYSSLIPLPHQIKILKRVVSGESVRYLLADEVGLGKTIEAGLILKELKLRERIKRILIISPAGLISQWIAEMKNRFGEEFKLFLPRDFETMRRFVDEENLWKSCDQVICSLDSVKPMANRVGWDQERVGNYNRERFENLLEAGWDLIIVDEAHRLGGSTEQVARFHLGKGLSLASPFLLLLSATPHQGKSDSFHRLMSLVDEEAFPTVESVNRSSVSPYVIRSEKRSAVDCYGNQLFKPRWTTLVPVSWSSTSKEQEKLYEAVTEYVRLGYNKAKKQKKNAVAFLMLLMQRLVTSSTAAIEGALKRRHEILSIPEQQLTLLPDLIAEDWENLSEDESLDMLVKHTLKAFKSEKEEVEFLLRLAEHTQMCGPDAKTQMLMEQIYELRQKEGDPFLKILIFTSFVATQKMLQEFLENRGFSVVTLNGSMNMDDRKAAERAFAEEKNIMISTDAGGEGLNLQFAHVVINYDLPWNPMKLEQRIGRVDRIGQNYPVRAFNFVMDNTVEYRVQQVLENKLEVILRELGVDKLGDVLDSAMAGLDFDSIFVKALMEPEKLEKTVDQFTADISKTAKQNVKREKIIPTEITTDIKDVKELMEHPLPYWVEKMTTSYVSAKGGNARRASNVWEITWPDGGIISKAVFLPREAQSHPDLEYLTLEDRRVRHIYQSRSTQFQNNLIPRVAIPDFPESVEGLWSLWRISLGGSESIYSRIMALFFNTDEVAILSTANLIWDKLIEEDFQLVGYLPQENSVECIERSRKIAEREGETIYKELVNREKRNFELKREKGNQYFLSKREILERIGLESVKEHRLKNLHKEQVHWETQMKLNEHFVPELEPLILLSVHGLGEKHETH